MPDQKMLDLKLKAGANEVVVKLVNYAWEWQFQWAFDPAARVAPAPHIEALLNAVSQRTDAQEADLDAYFRANVLTDAEVPGDGR